MPPSKAKPAFEELFKQLEEKVALLEQGGLSLDDSLSAYEDAVTLAKKCQDMLDGAELRITRLRATVAAGAEEPVLSSVEGRFERPDLDEEDEA